MKDLLIRPFCLPNGEISKLTVGWVVLMVTLSFVLGVGEAVGWW